MVERAFEELDLMENEEADSKSSRWAEIADAAEIEEVTDDPEDLKRFIEQRLQADGDVEKHELDEAVKGVQKELKKRNQQSPGEDMDDELET